MESIAKITDVRALKESVELECKLAAGRDHRGQLPDDFWKSYSAFANTRGGLILLGVLEEPIGKFQLFGIKDVEKVKTSIFDLVNNTQKVSSNVLSDDDVREHQIDGNVILSVTVRRAGRKERPVFIGQNPLSGTYRRIHSGDRRCDTETVKRMLAEQVEETRDAKIVRGFGLDCINEESLRTYRQAFRTARPGHVALDYDDQNFMRVINAWKRDAETGQAGLTAAGLLMFGNLNDIWQVFPKFLLDYQEQSREASYDDRWVDRLTLDGSWSGNLFDFYRRVYRKLVSDLKVPFVLEDGRRRDETSVHIAIREALVNAIIHADYSATAPVLIIRRPDMFVFRNPGHMRVPPDIARQGGEGDARNRLLQHMFYLVGASDRAGTGVPTIYRGWRERGWVPPAFAQIDVPSEQTRLDLRMNDLLPPSVIDRLSKLFGDKIDTLQPDHRLVLATAASENFVTNSRMQDICNMHRADITRMLQSLVKDGFLEQSGKTSGTFYYLPGQFDVDYDFDALLASLLVSDEAGVGRPKDEELEPKNEELGGKHGQLSDKDEDLLGAVLSPGFDPNDIEFGGRKNPIDDLTIVPGAILRMLHEKSQRAKSSGKLATSDMMAIICEICSTGYITANCIGELINRNERYVRDKLLTPMVQAGRLERSFPGAPSDPRQSYRSISE